ncbi:MAG: DUF4834 family protein [Phocaeicola sp.]
MLGFLGFIVVFFLLILIMGITILSRVVKALFGFGRKSSEQQQSYNSTKQEERSSETSSKDGNKKKIFTQEEGEYVDFEEVK